MIMKLVLSVDELKGMSGLDIQVKLDRSSVNSLVIINGEKYSLSDDSKKIAKTIDKEIEWWYNRYIKLGYTLKHQGMNIYCSMARYELIFTNV